jgi:putative addiction module component (TIGR02574 family)
MTAILEKRADELANRLTLTQRIEFAERLLTGIGRFANPEIARAWDAEINGRLEEYRAGRVKTLPSAQVHAEMKKRINEIKASRISSRSAD